MDLARVGYPDLSCKHRNAWKVSILKSEFGAVKAGNWQEVSELDQVV